MPVMRSCFYIPANSEKMVGKALTMGVDLITLDLEDSVPPSEKTKAREVSREFLKEAEGRGAAVYARINNWESPLTIDDLEAVVHPGLNGIVLPKCGHPDHVRRLEWKLQELEQQRGLEPGSIEVQVLIETAAGVIHAYECAIASPRINSLIFGAFDYTKDMRVMITKEGTELLHARAHTAVAARAAGLIAVDYPFGDIEDQAAFEANTLEGRTLGYEGRMLIHPNQIEPSHRLYTPSDEEVAWAEGVVEAFETEALPKGLAAIAYQGSMVDTPVYETAKAILVAIAEIRAKDEAHG